MANVKPIPDNYPRLCPYLSVDSAAEAIDFYKKVLGAAERGRIEGGGKVQHAELEFGDSLVMLADAFPELGIVSPKTVGGTSVTLNLYVEDVDQVFEAAVAEGAEVLRPIRDEFYGDRSGQFLDPFGHRWNLSTHIEDVSPEEMERRAAEATGG